MGGLNQR